MVVSIILFTYAALRSITLRNVQNSIELKYLENLLNLSKLSQ